MARLGVNPARGKFSAYVPAKITVAVLTCIPTLEGYFQHRLDVLKLVFASLQANTPLPHDVLVFDNGSCPAAIDYLRQLHAAGEIDFLLLSGENIGKIGAFKLIFHVAPGEIIAYADDDIFFYPGWLEAQLRIIDTFPRVSMVSGAPVRHASDRARRSLEALIEEGVPGLSVSSERRIPDEWEADWALSTGRDPEKHLQEMRAWQDLVLRLGNIEALGSASHFQFVAPKSVLLQALPAEWSGKLMGSMLELDEAIDNLGFLRLSTVERVTRHLGNALSPELIAEARAMGLPVEGKVVPRRPRARHWSLRFPGSRRVLKGLYNWLFDVLSGTD